MTELFIPIFSNSDISNSASYNRKLSLYNFESSAMINVTFLFLKSNRNEDSMQGNICLKHMNNPYSHKLFRELYSCYLLMREIRRVKKTVLVCLSKGHSFFDFFLIKLIKRKALFFQEISEFPFIGYNLRSISGFYKYIKYIIHMKSILKSNKFIIVITKNLYAYYKKYFKGDIYHIPMSVDFDRFQNVSNDTKVKYFMYCGRINCAKDGVDILVQAFIKLAAVYSDVSLLIVGPSHSKKDTEIITEIIDKSGFQDRIKFLGEINRENIPELLVGALGLCLARPNSTQAEGGFPTKLGEYLASGRPVAVTDTGEISDYLIDKVSAYIATPNDVNSFYIKLKEIIEDPKANEIGLKGREVALNNFSAMKQRRRIEEIIHNYIP